MKKYINLSMVLILGLVAPEMQVHGGKKAAAIWGTVGGAALVGASMAVHIARSNAKAALADKIQANIRESLSKKVIDGQEVRMNLGTDDQGGDFVGIEFKDKSFIISYKNWGYDIFDSKGRKFDSGGKGKEGEIYTEANGSDAEKFLGKNPRTKIRMYADYNKIYQTNDFNSDSYANGESYQAPNGGSFRFNSNNDGKTYSKIFDDDGLEEVYHKNGFLKSKIYHWGADPDNNELIIDKIENYDAGGKLKSISFLNNGYIDGARITRTYTRDNNGIINGFQDSYVADKVMRYRGGKVKMDHDGTMTDMNGNLLKDKTGVNLTKQNQYGTAQRDPGHSIVASETNDAIQLQDTNTGNKNQAQDSQQQYGVNSQKKGEGADGTISGSGGKPGGGGEGGGVLIDE